MDFKNTIIILTSNIGSEYLLTGIHEDGTISKAAEEQVNSLLRQHFRPEFLNRLDEIVLYKPLVKKEIFSIIDLLVERLSKRLEEQQLSVELTEAAKSFIADEAYDPVYGARPLKRYLQSKLETMLGRRIIQGDLPADGKFLIDAEEERLIIR